MPADPRAEAAVFDFDGLLADSQSAWDAAFADAADAAGVPLDDARALDLRGQSARGGARLMAAWAGRPHEEGRWERLVTDRLTERFRREPPPLMPGAEELLARLHGRLPLAIASNGPRPVVVAALERTGIAHRFARVVAADDAPRPKPWPDPYLAACAALGARPESSIAFEDSPLGAASAVAAGLRLVVVTPDAWPATRFADALDAGESAAVLHVDALDHPSVAGFVGVPSRTEGALFWSKGSEI
jgi:HAD superfamily hydrolase (TIGR01509 family)